MKQVKLIKNIFTQKSKGYFLNNIISRKFSLSIKNVEQENFPTYEKNHFLTFYVSGYFKFLK